MTEPPAFSTAATADLDAPQTEKATLALISPDPSNRTPSLARLSTPAFTRAAASTVAVGIELAGIDRRLDLAEIDLVELARERVFLKPRFGSRRWSGIWPPSKPLIRTPDARGLALAAAAAGLAGAGADAAADAEALLARARPVGEFVQLHRLLSLSASTTRTKCLTFAIMPRVCGVSGTSDDRVRSD